MFRITMLPAGRGDSLWIEYGKPSRPHALLIDAGLTKTASAVRRQLERQAKLDLLVVTHVDLDHIQGILPLLRKPPAGMEVNDTWFNAWQHLPGADQLLGPKEGERLSELITKRKWQWNGAFGGRAAAVSDKAKAEFPTCTLPGAMRLTLIAPRLKRLRELLPVWQEKIEEAGLVPGKAGRVLEEDMEYEEDEGLLGAAAVTVEKLAARKFTDDPSKANGSSIAFLAEFEGKRCLFAADANAADLERAVRRLAEIDGTDKLELDALKVSHHGGSHNTSPELLDSLRCRHFLFSSNGDKHKHPSKEAVARVLVHGGPGRKELIFNYRSSYNAQWDDVKLCKKFAYKVRYASASTGIGIDL